MRYTTIIFLALLCEISMSLVLGLECVFHLRNEFHMYIFMNRGKVGPVALSVSLFVVFIDLCSGRC